MDEGRDGPARVGRVGDSGICCSCRDVAAVDVLAERLVPFEDALEARACVGGQYNIKRHSRDASCIEKERTFPPLCLSFLLRSLLFFPGRNKLFATVPRGHPAILPRLPRLWIHTSPPHLVHSLPLRDYIDRLVPTISKVISFGVIFFKQGSVRVGVIIGHGVQAVT